MTAPLSKAILVRLQEVKGSGKKAKSTFREEKDGAFEVQFNPTSLKISRTNNMDKGGSTTRDQRRQSPSSQSATLTFDLEFDTAEELEPAGSQKPHHVDVRTRTRIVRQFAEPSKEKPTSPPPPVRFIWGTFVFTGLVTQVTEDLDYFSSDGRPLRAKVSVTITEKNLDLEAKLVGAAQRDQSTATATGTGQGSGPGGQPAKNPDTTERAQGGESLQQLLTRMNADPATWRAAMAGLDSPIGLAAGAQVQLAAGVTASAGVGASAGFALGANVSASATLGAALGGEGGAAAGASAGLSAGASAGVSAGASAGAGFSAGAGASAAGFTAGGGVAADAEAAAGFSLAEGGGVASSYAVVAAAGSEASVAFERSAFDVPSPAPGVARGVGSVSLGGLAATARVELDPRTQAYGAGVPLRARAQATTVVATSVGGSIEVSARSRSAEVPLAASPAAPPWEQLSARARADDAQQRRRDDPEVTLRWRPGGGR
jgi:hypothetical protein